MAIPLLFLLCLFLLCLCLSVCSSVSDFLWHLTSWEMISHILKTPKQPLHSCTAMDWMSCRVPMLDPSLPISFADGASGRSWAHESGVKTGARVLMNRDTGELILPLPREDTERRRPSANQEESSHQILAMSGPPSWLPSLQDWGRNECLYLKLPGLWYLLSQPKLAEAPTQSGLELLSTAIRTAMCPANGHGSEPSWNWAFLPQLSLQIVTLVNIVTENSWEPLRQSDPALSSVLTYKTHLPVTVVSVIKAVGGVLAVPGLQSAECVVVRG